MKLEVGMYVKTEKGYIYKLSRYEEDNNRWISSEENDWYPVYESLVTKASHNIIDLIEAGDYVNGVMVTEIKDGKPFKEDYNDPYYSYYFDDIYSIVTKEQFSQMEYKVGE